MRRLVLLLSLSITLLLSSAASAWACPQLGALLAPTVIEAQSGGCPHHSGANPADEADLQGATGFGTTCCCPAPLPPALPLGVAAPTLAPAPRRWIDRPHPTPPLAPLLRPPAPRFA